MSRTLALALIVLAACSDEGTSLPVDSAAPIDAATDARLVDARPVDAMIDAPPIIDAPPSAITTACTNACAALGVCAADTDAGCVGECSADLADCSAQQVQAVDACSTQACGDIDDPANSPIFMCLTAISCIEM